MRYTSDMHLYTKQYYNFNWFGITWTVDKHF